MFADSVRHLHTWNVTPYSEDEPEERPRSVCLYSERRDQCQHASRNNIRIIHQQQPANVNKLVTGASEQQGQQPAYLDMSKNAEWRVCLYCLTVCRCKQTANMLLNQYSVTEAALKQVHITERYKTKKRKCAQFWSLKSSQKRSVLSCCIPNNKVLVVFKRNLTDRCHNAPGRGGGGLHRNQYQA